VAPCRSGPGTWPASSPARLVTGLRRAELVPADGPVTPAAAWRRAGRPARAAGAADVVTGAKLFPSDLRLDGMLHGCVLHAPAAGAALRQLDTTAAEEMPGVMVVRDGALTGVVAADPRTARAALTAVRASWSEPAGPGPAGLASYLRDHPVQGRQGWSAPFRQETGDPDAALARGAVRLEARYSAAYVAHVPLEPRAALANWSEGQLTVWAATSTPFRARRELAAELGLSEDKVRVIVPDFGGGFGGKHGSAVALEAALLARAAGRPVKVQWSRLDEFTAGYLRPAAIIDVASSAAESGQLTGWSFTNIHSGSAGLATPYRIGHQRIAYQPAEGPLARGSYRALAATANNFARESHMDELAAAVGADPVAFRLRHLDDDRLATVLEAAAADIGWPDGGTPDAGTPDARIPDDSGGTAEHVRSGAGIAIGTEKGGRVATAARVQIAGDGTLRLARLVTAGLPGRQPHGSGPARGDRQVQGPADRGGVASADGPGQRQIRHSLGQHPQRDGGLQTGQRLPEAAVDAAGEREVLGRGVPVDAERAWLGVDLRVAVRAPDQRHHELASADHLALQLQRLQRHPPGDLDRRIEPQRLLDRPGRQHLRVGT